jgi:hypothetical protein
MKELNNEYNPYKPKFGGKLPEGEIYCAIRTSERKIPTLNKTIESLSNAGVENPVIYEDSEKKGSFKPFINCLNDILLKHNGWCLLCEDDVLFCNSSIDILKNSQFTSMQTATLFCSGVQDVYLKHDGWNNYIHNDWHCSLAYFVHTDLIKRIIETKAIKEWIKTDRVDYVWCKACEELQVKIHVHRPSLVQHIGETSTFGEVRKLSPLTVSKNWTQDY